MHNKFTDIISFIVLFIISLDVSAKWARSIKEFDQPCWRSSLESAANACLGIDPHQPYSGCATYNQAKPSEYRCYSETTSGQYVDVKFVGSCDSQSAPPIYTSVGEGQTVGTATFGGCEYDPDPDNATCEREAGTDTLNCWIPYVSTGNQTNSPTNTPGINEGSPPLPCGGINYSTDHNGNYICYPTSDNPEGTTTTNNPDGSQTNTYPDGSTTTNYPDGSSSSTYPDGSTSSTTPDGTTTTNNADGSTTTTTPDGTSTTTNPDGSSTTTSPDGTTTILSPDGTTNTYYPDGSSASTLPDGTTTYTTSGGMSTTTQPDGTVTTTMPDGSTSTDYPDGTHSETDTNGTTTTTSPDGTTSTHTSDGTTTTNHPDGSTTTSQPDGTTTTTHPDGSSTTTHPDGSTTTTTTDGTTTTTGGNEPTTTIDTDGTITTEPYTEPGGTCGEDGSNSSCTPGDVDPYCHGGLKIDGKCMGPDGKQCYGYILDNTCFQPPPDPETGETTVQNPDGSNTTINQDGTTTTTEPDGTTTTTQPDGTTTTTEPDGTTTTTHPDGSTTTTDPQGNTTEEPPPDRSASVSCGESASVNCDGDPINCAILKVLAKQNCDDADKPLSVEMPDKNTLSRLAGSTPDLPEESLDIAGQIDTAGLGISGQCPAPHQYDLGIYGSFTIDLSPLCNLAEIIGVLVMITATFISIRILGA